MTEKKKYQYKVVYVNPININGQKAEPDEIIESEETSEIRNLVKNGYIEKVSVK